MTTKQFGLLVATIVLIGGGCTQPVVSPEHDGEVAERLSFSSGDQFALRETFLGVSGSVVDFLGGSSTTRTIHLEDWQPDVSARVVWSMNTREETQASREAREQYDGQYGHTPVGTHIPEPPEPVMEDTVQSGVFHLSALAESDHVLLPHFWSQGEQTFEQNSLLWISRKQYQELAQTRHAQINLGLFDDSLAYAQSLSDRAKDLVNWLTKSTEEASRPGVLMVEARPAWGSYQLTINGETQSVRTLEAENEFARYTILANENNPLILEVVISPMARGSLNVFTKRGLFESFVGYEVTSITQNASSSVRPPQP